MPISRVAGASYMKVKPDWGIIPFTKATLSVLFVPKSEFSHLYLICPKYVLRLLKSEFESPRKPIWGVVHKLFI